MVGVSCLPAPHPCSHLLCLAQGSGRLALWRAAGGGLGRAAQEEEGHHSMSPPAPACPRRPAGLHFPMA